MSSVFNCFLLIKAITGRLISFFQSSSYAQVSYIICRDCHGNGFNKLDINGELHVVQCRKCRSSGHKGIYRKEGLGEKAHT